MKIFFGFFLLSILIPSFAGEIKVSKMIKDGDLERSFVLKTNWPEAVVIDCQSFIQGLRIGRYESAYTYLLDPEECEGLQQRIRSSLRRFQKHCIDVEDDIRFDRSCD
jgi:hypothetical protein